MKLQIRSIAASIFCFFLIPTATVWAVPFTYQGKLTDAGAEADGVYDFIFRLFDSEEVGTQVGSQLTANDVQVTNGLFTVDLDFGGVEAFDGSTRWLEIFVKPDADPSYTGLVPRQPIHPAPHSSYASFSQSMPWSCLSDVPAGLNDGDDDTLPGAGAGLSYTGNTLNVSFAGTGSVNSAARSNHNHDVTYAVTGHEHDSLHADPGSSSSQLHLYSNGNILALLDWDNSGTDNEFQVRDVDGTVFSVDKAGDTVASGSVTVGKGIWANNPFGDGLYVFTAGNPSTQSTSSTKCGLEIGGAEGHGVRIGVADQSGISIGKAGTFGMYIGNAGSDGLRIDKAGGYSIYSLATAPSFFNGDFGIGAPPLNRLHVRDYLNGAASVSNHVAQIQNSSAGSSPDVLLLNIGEVINANGSNIDASNNFISFTEGTNTSLGALQGNGSGGIQLAGPGNDYAEYLPRLDPREAIRPGDVVGVFNGFVSKRTEGADRIMAASTGAIVAGNDPGKEARDDYSLVAFIGQVKMRVRGPVRAGDLIIPSGMDDGCGVAVPATEFPIGQLASIVGQSWEDATGPGEKQVRCLVGTVKTDVLASLLQGIDARLQAVEQALAH